MRIDAHQHFWRYTPAAFGWIDPGGPLARDFGPDALTPLLATTGIDATIAVQALPEAAETDRLLALAAAHEWIAGVVGWLDLADPHLAAAIAARGPRLVGLRHLIQDELDADFMLRPEIVRGIATCVGAGRAYDILVRPHQARHVPELVARVGTGRFVLDHAAKPAIAAGGWQPWADDVARIAACPGVWCKLSGLLTEADHRDWQPVQIERYVAHLFATFGPERLIFASDWPVLTLAADYARWIDLVEDFVARYAPAHRAAIFGGNARAAYALPA